MMGRLIEESSLAERKWEMDEPIEKKMQEVKLVTEKEWKKSNFVYFERTDPLHRISYHHLEDSEGIAFAAVHQASVFAAQIHQQDSHFH
jgi:hypothetical protein